MSLHLPGRIHGRHRRLTPHQLSQHAAALETANDDLRQRLTATTARSNELEGMVTVLDRDLTDMIAERDQLLAEVRALRAERANRDAVRVPVWSASAEPTAPYGVDVSELRDRFEQGPVVRLGVSPLTDTVRLPVTDPAHIPGAA